jgi:hypothetical protein
VKHLSNLLVACAVIVSSLVTSASVAGAANCQFVLGFKALHDLIPSIVGPCVVDEHHNPQNGDGLQETTGTGPGGLLVWRKADNWTAYTDGNRTWINGPNGLQERLNTERFPWEASGTPVPASTPVPVATPEPASTPIPANTGHHFYLSTYYTAHDYYCDTDSAWQSLSKDYLQEFDSEVALLAAYPSRTLHQPC